MLSVYRYIRRLINFVIRRVLHFNYTILPLSKEHPVSDQSVLREGGIRRCERKCRSNHQCCARYRSHIADESDRRQDGECGELGGMAKNEATQT
jgi:hypothetical protein